VGDDVEHDLALGRIMGTLAELARHGRQQPLNGSPCHRLVDAYGAPDGADQQALLAGCDNRHQRHGRLPCGAAP
jgi:hypothetical protein